MRYFTSDLHFFDEGIIPYCGRPFSNAEEMNRSLIERFVHKLRGGGEVYILGDLINSKNVTKEQISPLLDEMGIRNPATPFHLILGNHDIFSNDDYLEMGFTSVNKINFINIGGFKFMLTHDPCMVQQQDTLAICGHIHTLFEHIYNPMRNTFTINVGVERRGYAPVSEDEILQIIKNSAIIAG